MRVKKLTRAIAYALAVSPLILLPQVALTQDVDLADLGDRGFSIVGIDVDDRFGTSVSGAGDVNGDGLSDIIIGAFLADPNDIASAGESYVVFGKSDGAPVDLDNLGSEGFRIVGVSVEDYSGGSVSGAGDVNGDGLDDLIVGASRADANGDSDAGVSYVVFGKSSGSTVDLANLALGGFRIDGIGDDDFSGSSVSGAGDVNGDGLSDLIIGAWGTDIGNDRNTGATYVIFGKSNSAAIDLDSLGPGGFRIDGINATDRSGFSVSGAGDVNGDGLADLVLGAHTAGPGDENGAGESYIVFGKVSSTLVDLANLGPQGFRIPGVNTLDRNGISSAGAGDVNGDGLADLIVGASTADPDGRTDAGQSYVIFGKADSAPIDLDNLGAEGFQMLGADDGDIAGFSVAGSGDVNGDGLADLVVGAPRADPDGDENAGAGYVLFGKPNEAPIDFGDIGADGFRINGVQPQDNLGLTVSGAGDVNGDGLADVILGAPGELPPSSPGEIYVVFSELASPSNAIYRVRSGNGNAPRMAVGVSGDGSNDSTPDGRFWVDFSDGNDTVELASIETVTLARSDGGYIPAAANVSWQFETTRQNWTSAEVTVRYLDDELLIENETILELVFSPDGNAPFTPLTSQVNPQNNTISATISQPGFLYISQRELPDDVFADRFESSLP